MLNELGLIVRIEIACHLGEYTMANEWLRAVCTNRPHNMALWNLFYQVMTKYVTWTIKILVSQLTLLGWVAGRTARDGC